GEPAAVVVGEAVADDDLAAGGVPAARAAEGVGEEEVGEGDAGVVLEAPLVPGREEAGVAALPVARGEAGGAGGVGRALVVAEEAVERLEGGALLGRHRGEGGGEVAAGGLDVVEAVGGEAEVERRGGVVGPGGGEGAGGLGQRLVVAGVGVDAEAEAVGARGGGVCAEGGVEVLGGAGEGAVGGAAVAAGGLGVPSPRALGEGPAPAELA